jgi:Fe-S cluster biogenesis protein NfuA
VIAAFDDKAGDSLADLLASADLSCEEKIHKVIDGYIEPVLKNDGGRIEFIDFNAADGEVSVRFLGSCANCPYSMLSLETLVIPPLLSIPGVTRVSHRGFLREGEKQQIDSAAVIPLQMIATAK